MVRVRGGKGAKRLVVLRQVLTRADQVRTVENKGWGGISNAGWEPENQRPRHVIVECSMNYEYIGMAN